MLGQWQLIHITQQRYTRSRDTRTAHCTPIAHAVVAIAGASTMAKLVLALALAPAAAFAPTAAPRTTTQLHARVFAVKTAQIAQRVQAARDVHCFCVWPYP